MFRKLRIKLTLINASIILALFLLLIIGSLYISQTTMTRSGELLAHKLAEDVNSGRLSDWPPHKSSSPGIRTGPLSERPTEPPPSPPSGLLSMPPPVPPHFFFIKTSPAGAITFKSAGQPLADGLLEELTQKALSAVDLQGTITVGQTEYFYLKSRLDNQPGMLVIFHDFAWETGIMKILLTALTVFGIVGLLLSQLASLFMANKAMRPLQEAWQQQQDFLADASHELRTPLAVIRTNLEIVLDSPGETIANQSQWLENILEETLAMTKLVDSLLFLARADAEQQQLDKRRFSFNEVLEQASAPFKPLMEGRKLSFNLHCNVPFIQACGDAARIKQLINILLDNAIRHTPPGGNISAYLSQSDRKIILTITDTGEGMEKEHLNKIFERFYQVKNSPNKGSSGLGLAIAKWIVEKHGGEITADSALGEGTSFTIIFPAA